MMDDIDRTFDWYRAALIGQRGPIDADNPKAGFYRSKSKDGSLSAVAIWYDTFTYELRYQDNGKDVDDQKARERWPYVSKSPITEAIFWQFRDTGVWGDIDETAQSINPRQKHAGASGEAGGPDPAGEIKTKIAEAKTAVPQYLKLESDEAATRAQSLRSVLTSLKGEAKKQYDALNRPLLDEQKRIRTIWNPIMEDADSSAAQLRSAIEDWETHKRQSAKAAEVTGSTANTPMPSAKISGGMGRSASVKPYSHVVKIDIDRMFSAYKEHGPVVKFFYDLAQELVDSGIDVPGVETEERVKVR